MNINRTVVFILLSHIGVLEADLEFCEKGHKRKTGSLNGGKRGCGSWEG